MFENDAAAFFGNDMKTILRAASWNGFRLALTETRCCGIHTELWYNEAAMHSSNGSEMSIVRQVSGKFEKCRSHISGTAWKTFSAVSKYPRGVPPA